MGDSSREEHAALPARLATLIDEVSKGDLRYVLRAR